MRALRSHVEVHGIFLQAIHLNKILVKGRVHYDVSCLSFFLLYLLVTLLDPFLDVVPMGTLHGGILCDIADATMGMAFASTLAPEESFTTVELKVNFFRPIWQAQLRAEGTVVQRGPHQRVR
jgi:Thioesterase superfamily